MSESESHSVLFDSLRPHGLYSPWNFSGQNTEVGSLSFLQVIFPTQGSSPVLRHCRRILYQLSHQGIPRILEWVAYPFSRGSSAQESNRSLLHCRQTLYQLSYEGVNLKLAVRNCDQCCEICKQWAELKIDGSGSFGHGWEVFPEEVTFTLGLAESSMFKALKENL